MALRHLIALPLTCMALLAVLTFASPSLSPPGIPIYAAAVDDLRGIMAPMVQVETKAVIRIEASADSPRDAHRIAYVAANQPLRRWRDTVDAYRHIDPHIRVMTIL